MSRTGQAPTYYQKAGFPILNMEKTFDKFFDELAENTLGRSKLKEINDDAKSTYLYTELENGKLASRSKILQDHMHTHPMGYITGTRLDLILETENFLEKLDANSSLRKPTAKLLSYWYGANSLRANDRFLSRNQPPINTFPIGDGSNLRNPNNIPSFNGQEWSEGEWQFRTLFIRALHFPGLLTYDAPDQGSWDGTRAYYFEELYVAGRILLELEHNQTCGRSPEYPHNQDDRRWQYMQWIKVSRNIIDTALEAMFKAAETPVGPVVDIVADRTLQGVASTEATIVYLNMENAPDLLAKAMQQAIDTSLGQFAYERLLLELLDQQDTFERLLAVEHIDDKLVTKQVSIFDEEDIVTRPEAWEPDELSDAIEEFEPRIFGILHDIAFVNRQRRIWRLFKDWNPGHRPWIKMFRVYSSTAPADAWVQAPLELFRNRTLADDKNNPLDARADHPTSYKNMAWDMWDVMPTTLESLDPLKRNCIVCKLEFAPVGVPLKARATDRPASFYDPFSPLAHTITQLLCNDVAHTTCIFIYWSKSSSYTHDCPECKKFAPLNWEVAALHPLDINGQFQNTFAHNVFADPKVTNLLSRAKFNPFELRMRKEVYDLPKPLGQSYSVGQGVGAGSNAFLNREATAYWTNELNNLALADRPEVSWKGMTFVPGQTTSQIGLEHRPVVMPLSRGFGAGYTGGVSYNAPLNAQARINDADRSNGMQGIINLGRNIGAEYMRQVYQPDPNLPNHMPGVYDISNERILKPSRMLPSVEAAALRRAKKMRNIYQRRAAAASPGGTLGGTAGT